MHMPRFTRIISLAGITVLLASVLATSYTASPASALSGSQFSAGNIIDDSVFFDSSTMSANSIQAFLNSKVPSCDTNGSKSYNGGQTRAQYGAANGQPGPYTCLRDFTQNTPSLGAEAGICNGFGAGTKSAAQIINEVSLSCGINPQVLIVLLQKEQSLITDEWPWSNQYRAATGYGCPDTAACDSTYYGFFNQVYNAARGFKKYAQNAGSFNYRAGRNNNILYNPVASCGSSSVFVQNQATANLYIYTPYQPNQAALNNLYGTGDSCSAYGNRNFWRMFNDWFGPTVGPLLRTADSGELYYSDGTSKYRVGSMYIANEYGLGLSSVRIVPQSVLDSLQTSQSTPYLTYVLKSSSDGDDDGGSMYLVSSGKRYLVTSMDQFADFGFTMPQISYLDYAQLMRLPLAGNLSNYVKSSYGGYVFKIEDGTRRGILDATTLNKLHPGGAVIDMNDYIVGNIPRGQSIINANLVLKDGGGGIWLVTEDNVWHYVSSMTAYHCLGLGSMANIPYSTYQTDVGTQGPDATCSIKSASTNQRYILDNWRRIPIDGDWGMADVFTVPDSFASLHGTYNPTVKPVFRSAPDAPLYVLSGGKKRQVYSMASFNQSGYTMNDIFTASSDFLGTIPTGAPMYGDGTVIQDASNGKLYVIAGTARYYIPSMGLFSAYGYTAGNIIPVSSTTISAYTDAGTISTQTARTPSATVFDSGIALQVPLGLEAAYGFNGGQPSYPAAVASSGAVRQATRYVKFNNSATLYYMDNGTKRPVYSWDMFVSLGGSLDNITGLSGSAASLFPDGPSM